jgi:hypothetical protein
MAIYLGTSLLVPLLIREPGTPRVQAFVSAGAAKALLISLPGVNYIGGRAYLIVAGHPEDPAHQRHPAVGLNDGLPVGAPRLSWGCSSSLVEASRPRQRCNAALQPSDRATSAPCWRLREPGAKVNWESMAAIPELGDITALQALSALERQVSGPRLQRAL